MIWSHETYLSFGYNAVIEWWIADHMKSPITTKICGSSSIGRASDFQSDCCWIVPRLPLHMRL